MPKGEKKETRKCNNIKYDRTGLQENFRFFSQKLGDISRQLSFSGIAIVWIFTVNDGTQKKIPHVLLYPLGCFALALLFDLLHYTYGTIRDGVMNRYYEKKETGRETETLPWRLDPKWNWPKLFFKFGAVFGVIVGYVIIAWYILKTACQQ